MGKKQKCPEFENHERWLVSYADMLTLLFAVFVVLFALKKGGEPQNQKAAGSMQESFNTPLQDIPVDRTLGPAEQGFGVFEHFRGDQTRPPMIQKYPTMEKRIRLIEHEMNRAKKEMEERLYGPKTAPETKGDSGLSRVVSIERTKSGFKFQLLARHFYRPGEIVMKRESLDQLDQIVEILKNLGRDIQIQGHTDSSTPKDANMDNWDLSALRATYVVRYLLEHHHFPQSKIAAVGFGDSHPIAHNGTVEGRNLNSRIEIHVTYDPQEQHQESTPDSSSGSEAP